MRDGIRRGTAAVFCVLAVLFSSPFSPTPSAAASNETSRILELRGAITPGAFNRFRAELARLNPDLIVVEGPGGGVFEAMLIGTEIRRRGLPTLVRRNRSCASACAIIFLSGHTKVLEDGASLGMHAASTNGQTADARGTTLMYAYLERVGVPSSMSRRMAAIPPGEIRWLTQAEQRKLGIRQ